MDDCAPAGKSIEMDIYVMFISPDAEVQWNVYMVKVLCIGQANSLTHTKWQVDMQQLIDQLATQAPQVTGRHACIIQVCHSHRLPKIRCNGDLIPGPIAP